LRLFKSYLELALGTFKFHLTSEKSWCENIKLGLSRKVSLQACCDLELGEKVTIRFLQSTRGRVLAVAARLNSEISLETRGGINQSIMRRKFRSQSQLLDLLECK